MPLLLALDFGGTKHAAAVTPLGSRKWQAYKRKLAPPSSNATTDLEIMDSLIKTVLNGATPAAIRVSLRYPK